VSEDAYTLRLARADDVPALEALIDASVRVLGQGFYTPAEIDAGLRHVFGVDTQLIVDGTYYVIEQGGVPGSIGQASRDTGNTPVACGGWSGRRTLFGGDQHKSGIDGRLDPAVDPARIRAFFVHPDHARRGLARTLYDTCARAAYAQGFLAFELMATLPGVPLYAALGFEALEPVAVPTPAGVPLPCVRMRRTIAAR
jgi:GNAT superfamily N-acetyltransferase